MRCFRCFYCHFIIYIFLGCTAVFAQQPDSSNWNGGDLNPGVQTDSGTVMHPDSTSIQDADTTAKKEMNLLDRVIENDAFEVGEKLTFKIRYGWIKAGEATMEVRERFMIDDEREAYKIVSTAKSSRGFDPFFKVRDEVETHLDATGFYSWYFSKKLREGGYKYDLLVDYNQAGGSADVKTIRYHKDEPLRVRKTKEFAVDIPEYVLDILGSFYYVRTQELEVGMPLYMTNHDNKKIYELRVIIEKKETIKVKAGKFRCIKVQPVLKGDALFKQKGKLWVWLTDDKYKIPVQMKSKVAVGSITTELIRIEGVATRPPAQLK